MGGGRGDSIAFTSVALIIFQMSSSRKKQREGKKKCMGQQQFLVIYICA